MRKSNELQIGKAGEYLVCADLIIKGFISFPSEQGLPYDVLLDNGKRLLKIQVKTTGKPRIVPQRKEPIPAYIFNVKRAGHLKITRYTEEEIDLFALVCLDTMEIGYIINKNMPDTLNLRVDSFNGKYYDEKGIQDYKKCIELHKTVSNKSEVARILNINVSITNRYLRPNFKPFKTNARYFSNIKRDKKWFLNL